MTKHIFQEKRLIGKVVLLGGAVLVISVTALCLMFRKTPSERLLAELGRPEPDSQRVAELVPEVIRVLQNDDWKGRCQAVTALQEVGDHRVLEPLIAALNDEDSYVRSAAAKALGRIGDPKAVGPLIHALNDSAAPVRASAAKALGLIGDDVAVEDLIARLEDRDAFVSQQAAEALGRIASPASLKPLLAAMSHADSFTRQEASEAVDLILGEMGAEGSRKLIMLLCDADEPIELHKHAEQLLAESDDPGRIPMLISALKADSHHVDIVVANLLEPLGKRAVTPLIAALSHEDSHVRSQAALILRSIGADAVEPLLAAMNGNSNIANRCAIILGKMGDSRAVDRLVIALGDETVDVRLQAIALLGRLGGKGAAEPLIPLMRDDNADVRQNAAHALGSIADARAVQPLIAGLDDPEWKVRKTVAEALGMIGDARAITPLVQKLTDRHITHAVANMLENRGWQPKTKAQRVHFLVGKKDSAALTAPSQWQETKEVLLADVQSNDKQRIAYGLKALTALGRDDVLPDLLKVIEAQGTLLIANSYINCNHSVLRQAAIDWAKAHGYDIIELPGRSSAWNWGSWEGS